MFFKMPHLSEDANPLLIHLNDESITSQKKVNVGLKFIILPYYNNLDEIDDKERTYNELLEFIERSDENTTIGILTSPIVAADLINYEFADRYYKTWIAVKLKDPIVNKEYIDRRHCALIIFGKYKQSILHTKTRVKYSYCPYCNKTTKDYGGKKHLYHEFGTLMSDVWRDIEIDFNSDQTEIVDRLKSVFGLNIYTCIDVYDQRPYYAILKNKSVIFKNFDQNNQNIQNIESEFHSKLILGDCLEKLKQIPDNSIDFCFADPPYNIKKKYQSWHDGLDIKEYFDWCDNWLSELARVLKPGRTLAVLNIPQWAIRHFKYLNTILDYQDWIVWEGLSIPSKNIVPIHYTVLCFSKGKPITLPAKARLISSTKERDALLTQSEQLCLRTACVKQRSIAGYKDKELASNIWWDIHRLMHNSRRVDHPCQLPPNFMYRLISLFTYEHEIVLDPFNGVGTTTLCAQVLNRKYIGIESSKYYHDITCERHAEISSGLDPFRKKSDDIYRVKNSRIERIEKQKYKVTKKALQLEVKRIAKEIDRIPTKEELFRLSSYPSEYFEKYFVNWTEVFAAAKTTGMSEFKEVPTDVQTLF